MICPHCNAQIPDGTTFCTACGAPVPPAQPLSYPPPVPPPPSGGDTSSAKPPAGGSFSVAPPPLTVPKKPAKAKGACLPACIAGIVIGTICLFFGLYTLFSASCSIHSTSFGGDFYTYTYKGIVAVAELMVTLIKSAAMLCVGLGGFMDCYFINQLIRK